MGFSALTNRAYGCVAARYVGLDDHWQNCTRVCANGTVIPSWLVNHGFDYLGCENNTGSYTYPWYSDDGVPQVLRQPFYCLRSLLFNRRTHRRWTSTGSRT